jgi:hypothetical protein
MCNGSNGLSCDTVSLSSIIKYLQLLGRFPLLSPKNKASVCKDLWKQGLDLCMSDTKLRNIYNMSAHNYRITGSWNKDE